MKTITVMRTKETVWKERYKAAKEAKSQPIQEHMVKNDCLLYRKENRTTTNRPYLNFRDTSTP